MTTTVIWSLQDRKKVGPGLYLLGSHVYSLLSDRLSTEERKTTEVSLFQMAGIAQQRYQQFLFQSSGELK